MIAKEVSEKQSSCEADLAAAEPLVAEAMAALETVTKKDLGEAKSLKKPPQVGGGGGAWAGARGRGVRAFGGVSLLAKLAWGGLEVGAGVQEAVGGKEPQEAATGGRRSGDGGVPGAGVCCACTCVLCERM